MTTLTAFHEEQRFRQPWIWLLILGTAGVQWWGWIQQIVLGRPFGSNPAPDWVLWLLLLLVGIGLPLLFWNIRLLVKVDANGIEMHYWPLSPQRIRFEQITGCQVDSDYQPLQRYGGWGVRGSAQSRAYSVAGKQAVRLALRDGRELLIGTQRPTDLALAIDAFLPVQ
ncbi:MAG: DUF6141 family protein [Caldilineales bacterium]